MRASRGVARFLRHYPWQALKSCQRHRLPLCMTPAVPTGSSRACRSVARDAEISAPSLLSSAEVLPEALSPCARLLPAASKFSSGLQRFGQKRLTQFLSQYPCQALKSCQRPSLPLCMTPATLIDPPAGLQRYGHHHTAPFPLQCAEVWQEASSAPVLDSSFAA